MGEVDLLVFADCEDFLDDAVGELQEFLAESFFGAFVLAAAVELRRQFEAHADSAGFLVAAVHLGVLEADVGDVVGGGEFVGADELAQVAVGGNDDSADEVGALPPSEVVEDAGDEDRRGCVLVLEREAGQVALDKQAHDLLFERVCLLLAVALQQEEAQRSSGDDDLVKTAAAGRDLLEVGVVHALGLELGEDLRPGERQVGTHVELKRSKEDEGSAAVLLGDVKGRARARALLLGDDLHAEVLDELLSTLGLLAGLEDLSD